MPDPNEHKGLRFACECVSSLSGHSDPWSSISQNKLLPDGTKESILNSVAKEQKTIAHLAKELDLSQPSIHRHIGEMMASELLRESKEWERRYPSERYYEPNFPIVKADERAVFEAICKEMAEQVADLFENRPKTLERAFVTQHLDASVQRGARELLEERGTLPLREKHRNGVEWLFWAEEESSDK